jgi:hypothetical protein
MTTTPTSKSDRPSIEELELDLVELECTLEAIDEEHRRGMTVTPAQIRLHMVQRAPAEFGCIRVVVRRTRVVTMSLSTQPSLGLVALVDNRSVTAQMLARPAV